MVSGAILNSNGIISGYNFQKTYTKKSHISRFN
jgi:hypothetical protein